MVSYLKAYRLGLVIRSSFSILFRNWVTLFAIYAVPLLPVFALKVIVAPPEASLAGVVFLVLQYLVVTFATYPATVAVSEYCLAIKPSFSRSYARAFAAPGRLVTTFLLFLAIYLAGFIVFIVPAIVFSVWYMFMGPVVVLEGIGNMAALRRSRELGRGYYTRNFGVLFVTQLIVMGLSFVTGGIIGAIIGFLYALRGVEMNSVLIFDAGFVVGVAFGPASLVAFVLLYYDMRVRKEGYGAAQLAEDIRI